MRLVYISLVVLVVANSVLAQDVYRPPYPTETTTTEKPRRCVPCPSLVQRVCGADGKIYQSPCVACCEVTEYCSAELPEDAKEPCTCKPDTKCPQ